MPSNIDNCNAALFAIGADEITALDGSDESREAKICSLWYPSIAKNLISTGNWKFAYNEVSLPQLTDVPLMEYQYAYQLPSDYTAIVAVNIPSRDYRVVGQKIYTNASQVSIRYKYVPDESIWKPYFSLLVQYELAALLSSALLEDADKAAQFTKMADRQRVMARFTDSNEFPIVEHSLINFPFVSVRISNGC